MKKHLLFLSILCAQTISSFGQTMFNEDFENWEMRGSNTYEEPAGWSTNNFRGFGLDAISVKKSSTAQNGQYALSIQSAALGFLEGPAPGEAKKLFYPTADYSNIVGITAYVRVDSITSPGKCTIYITEYKDGAAQVAGYWEASEVDSNFQMVSIPLTHVFDEPDSILVRITAETFDTGSEYIGYAGLLVDQMLPEMVLGTSNDQAANQITVFPNPTHNVAYVQGADNFHSYNLQHVTGDHIVSNISLESNAQIDFSNLQPGAYLLKLNAKNGGSVYKTIIRR